MNTLLLDKTGTITFGNRQATEFLPAPGATEADMADAAQLSSLADETPEGRSIVVLAKEDTFARPDSPRMRHNSSPSPPRPVCPESTWMAGKFAKAPLTPSHSISNKTTPPFLWKFALRSSTSHLLAAHRSSSPKTVGPWAHSSQDVVKGGIRDRFAQLRAMGIRTVMITGDNPLTAAAIAREAGVDDFLAQATPEDKMKLIRAEQAGGKLVAMTGDGTNDAPALAQAAFVIWQSLLVQWS